MIQCFHWRRWWWSHKVLIQEVSVSSRHLIFENRIWFSIHKGEIWPCSKTLFFQFETRFQCLIWVPDTFLMLLIPKLLHFGDIFHVLWHFLWFWCLFLVIYFCYWNLFVWVVVWFFKKIFLIILYYKNGPKWLSTLNLNFFKDYPLLDLKQSWFW